MPSPGAVTPRVMALVPTWNAARFIERTLASLAEQTYPNLEILISDDASRDGTVAECMRFVNADERFHLFEQDENLGWLGNTNWLLRNADADYLLFAFHDDALLPGYIESCVAALEATSDAVVAFSDMVTHFQDGSHEIGRCTLLDGHASRVERAKRMLWRVDHWWAPNRGVFRADAAKRIGGLKRNMAGEFSADWPWLVHMMLLGDALRIPEVLVEKHYEQHSVSRAWNFSARHQMAVSLACAREIRESQISVPEKLRLYATLAAVVKRLLGRLSEREIRARR